MEGVLPVSSRTSAVSSSVVRPRAGVASGDDIPMITELGRSLGLLQLTFHRLIRVIIYKAYETVSQ